jgi:hypothetical protein
MSSLHYRPTVLQGTTKVGKIRCGADGYYDMLAGGFDAYNSTGAFYTWDSAPQRILPTFVVPCKTVGR